MIFTTPQGNWNLDIPSNHHTAIIKMSGGADSAMMAYCIAKYKKEERPDLKIIIATTNGYPPKDWHIRYANKVCDKIQELTGIDMSDRRQNQMKVDEVTYLGSDSDEQVRLSNYDKAQKENEANILAQENNPEGRGVIFFNGMTANPPKDLRELYEDFHDGIKHMRMDQASYLYERDPDVTYETGSTKEELEEAYSWCWQQPFRNFNKRSIAELYKSQGILDELFPITRSCENGGDVEYIKDPNMEFHCKECWWCRERFWGFNRYI